MTTSPGSPPAARRGLGQVVRWIEEHAGPLTSVEPGATSADLDPLRGMVGDATVVGLGASTRGAHELLTLQHRLLRFLVEELGFRSLAVEEEWAKVRALDEYVSTGVGDPRALLAEVRPFWRTEEFLAAVRWVRSYNRGHPHDGVRLVGVGQSVSAVHSLDDAEREMADNTVRWQRHTGDGIVYWGGMAHTVDGDPRTISAPPSSPQTQRSAGSYLREHFGRKYVSVGLTFQRGSLNSYHGSEPYSVPEPPPDFADAVLGDAAGGPFLLGLHGEQPEEVRSWLGARTRMRLIGPGYDADDDSAHHLSGGSPADWLDAVAGVPEVTPTRPLP